MTETTKVDKFGNKSYYKNGLFHRDYGPAIEYNDGFKAWYINGKIHRENGPAIEWADGTKFFFKNGVLHREDGPAIEWADGTKEYYYNNKEIECSSTEEFLKIINSFKSEVQENLNNYPCKSCGTGLNQGETPCWKCGINNPTVL